MAGFNRLLRSCGSRFCFRAA